MERWIVIVFVVGDFVRGFGRVWRREVAPLLGGKLSTRCIKQNKKVGT